jgi:hypothetical protein
MMLDGISRDAKDGQVALVFGVETAVVAGGCHDKSGNDGQLLGVLALAVTALMRVRRGRGWGL